jgi:hypothetical protein
MGENENAEERAARQLAALLPETNTPTWFLLGLGYLYDNARWVSYGAAKTTRRRLARGTERTPELRASRDPSRICQLMPVLRPDS